VERYNYPETYYKVPIYIKSGSCVYTRFHQLCKKHRISLQEGLDLAMRDFWKKVIGEPLPYPSEERLEREDREYREYVIARREARAKYNEMLKRAKIAKDSAAIGVRVDELQLSEMAESVVEQL
jgi:hypothetical protein